MRSKQQRDLLMTKIPELERTMETLQFLQSREVRFFGVVSLSAR